MRVLGIETSTDRGSVALWEDGVIVAERTHEQAASHAELLPGLLDELFAATGWAKRSLDRVAVGVGPGSFTGLRVGVALAQGIALGLERPLVGVGSLEALAAGVDRADPRDRLAVSDARRGDAFLGRYAATGAELAPVTVVPVASLAELAAGAVFVGAAAASWGLAPRLTEAAHQFPSAREVATLGARRAPDGRRTVPEYHRDPDVIKPPMVPSPFARPPGEAADDSLTRELGAVPGPHPR